VHGEPSSDQASFGTKIMGVSVRFLFACVCIHRQQAQGIPSAVAAAAEAEAARKECFGVFCTTYDLQAVSPPRCTPRHLFVDMTGDGSTRPLAGLVRAQRISLGSVSGAVTLMLRLNPCSRLVVRIREKKETSCFVTLRGE
jgi:hypothetical protein